MNVKRASMKLRVGILLAILTLLTCIGVLNVERSKLVKVKLMHSIMRGDLGITKLYRFRAVLSPREDRYIYLEKPVRVDKIEFRPIES